jgi:hypothetical protein
MKKIKGKMLTTTPPLSGGEMIYGKEVKKKVKDRFDKDNLNEREMV